nr:hypothetical protein RP007_05857 [Rhizobium sp. P007]
MSLQGDGKEEKRVLRPVRRRHDLFHQRVVGGKIAAFFHGRQRLFGAEFLEAEIFIDLLAVPEPFLERMNCDGGITFAAEEAGERGHRAADILLVGNAAIGQEGVREAGQCLEFHICRHAAELGRKHVAGLFGADGRHGIGREIHVFKPGRIPQGFAHQHDDVRVITLVGGERCRFRGEIGDAVFAVTLRRRDIGHGNIEGEGHQEAVVAVVFLLIPHHGDDVEAIAHPGIMRIVHQRGEAGEKRQRQRKAGGALTPAQYRRMTVRQQPESREGGNCGAEADTHQHRRKRLRLQHGWQKFENLPPEQQV